MENGHRRMNHYHKKSSIIGRSSSMEHPGKLVSSLASAEFKEEDYKLTDDAVYENKRQNNNEDSNDTIFLNNKDNFLLNDNFFNYNKKYFQNSKNLEKILDISKKYFSDTPDFKQFEKNKKIFGDTNKQLLLDIQNLTEEYKNEKIRRKELTYKIYNQKIREKNYNNELIHPEERKKRQTDYICFLEDNVRKLETENNELINILNSQKTSNIDDDIYKNLIENEIIHLKKMLQMINKNEYNQMQNIYTTNEENICVNRKMSFGENCNNLFDTSGDFFEENQNNENNMTNNNKNNNEIFSPKGYLINPNTNYGNYKFKNKLNLTSTNKERKNNISYGTQRTLSKKNSYNK